MKRITKKKIRGISELILVLSFCLGLYFRALNRNAIAITLWTISFICFIVSGYLNKRGKKNAKKNNRKM